MTGFEARLQETQWCKSYVQGTCAYNVASRRQTKLISILHFFILGKELPGMTGFEARLLETEELMFWKCRVLDL